MEQQQDDSADKGAFNFAIEYLRTLMNIERKILESFLQQNYDAAHHLLDLYWLELVEWLKPKTKDMKMPEHSIENHDTLRKEQHDAHAKIMTQIQQGKKTIPSIHVDKFYNRFRALNKVIHDRGLRMPKQDNPGFALGGKSY